MLAYIFRRALQSVVVLLVVGLVAFSMFRFVGDPVDNLLGQERTDADIERLREQLGLNDPFPVQYWDFLTRAVQGDLGVGICVCPVCVRFWRLVWDLHGYQAERVYNEPDSDHIIDWRVASNISDRYIADICLCC